MSQELLYTSAPRGLKPGSRGFCTVLSTQGMSAPLGKALEGLSGYRPVYTAGDPRSGSNPVVFSHLKLQCAGKSWHVLSRIADFGQDYSQRANKLAHHVVLDPEELLEGGPANLLRTPGVMRTNWEGEPKIVGTKSMTREATPHTGVCRAWQQITGDAGWAGVVAESFLSDPERLVILLFSPGQDVLSLFAEAISLLPEARRWDVTFSSYFTGLATGTTCCWRAMVHDSKEAHDSIRFVNALRIDLTSGALGTASGGPLVDCARTGTRHVQRIYSDVEHFDEAVDPDVEFESAEDQGVEFKSANEVVDESVSEQSASVVRVPPRRLLRQAKNEGNVCGAPRRRLADVIDEENQRSNSSSWIWISLVTCLVLIALSTVAFLVKDRISNGVTADERIRTERSALKYSSSAPKTSNPTAPTGELADSRNNQSSSSAVPINDQGNPTPDSPPVNTSIATSLPSETAPPTPSTASAGKDSGTAVSQTKTSSHQEVQVKTVPLPRKDSPVTLYEFPAPVPIPPRLRILKPHWLPYSDAVPSRNHEKNYNAKRAIVAPATLGETPIGLFVVSQGGSHWDYTLKSLNDDHMRWLGWYRIQVRSGDSANSLIKELAFASFPMDSSKLNRNFGKGGSVHWSLPAETPSEESRRPLLLLESLDVAIGETTYHLEVPQNDARSSWIVQCREFESGLISKLGEKSTDRSHLRIDISVKDDNPRIEFALAGQNGFIKVLEDSIDTRRFRVEPETIGMCDIDADLKNLVKEQFNALGIREKGAGAADSTLNPAIQQKIQELVTSAEKRDDKEMTTQLRKMSDQIAKLRDLVNDVNIFRNAHRQLDNVVIRAARISYVLKDTDKNSDVTETVEIVSFSDERSRNSDGEAANEVKKP